MQAKDIQLGTTERYSSLTASAKSLKVSRTAISKAIHSGKLLKNRWLLKTLENQNKKKLACLNFQYCLFHLVFNTMLILNG